MQKLIITLLSVFGSLNLIAQANANQIFIKLNEAIQKLEYVSYDRAFEIYNPSENYFHKDTSNIYVEFNTNYPADVFRTTRKGNDFKRLYTQENVIFLQTKDKTYEIEKSDIGAASIYHSVLDLRVALPKILREGETKMSLADTTLNGQEYFCLKVTLPAGRNINFPHGLGTLGIKTIISTYTFIIDKTSYLPYLLVYTKSDKVDYATKNYFLNINTRPVQPDSMFWNLAGYPEYRQKAELANNPIIKVGDSFPVWTLPVFQPQNLVKTMSSDEGKVTVLEFWVKNCGYCQEAFKDMKQLSEKYKDTPINILSVNIDDKDTLKDLEFIFDKHKPIYPILYKGENLAKSVGIYSYPRTIILDKDGKVILHAAGFSFNKVDTFLEKLAD